MINKTKLIANTLTMIVLAIYVQVVKAELIKTCELYGNRIKRITALYVIGNNIFTGADGAMDDAGNVYLSTNNGSS
jgi:hypothetical protein